MSTLLDSIPPAVLSKLDTLVSQHDELEQKLADPDVLTDHRAVRELSIRKAAMADVVASYREFRRLAREAADLRMVIAGGGDPEFVELARAELPELDVRAGALLAEVKTRLVNADDRKVGSVMLEIRAGTGGDEAALWARDLLEMYQRLSARRRWVFDPLDVSADGAGIRSAVINIRGEAVWSELAFEAGVHSVKRVPATEAQGRIHTSTATVAVLPEADDVDVQIDDKDLDISIAASGGPGGQGVNTTNSAVQIRHIPTGLIVKCQDERSQLKNKAKALKVLKSRLLDIERKRQEEALSAERRTMVGSAERSQKIRTYNYPQNRVTDHRIGLTMHKLDRIMDGDIDELIAALRTHRQAELLKQGGAEARPAELE
ncbi:MAG TPA: peptide chain release factor 1 [Polyangium sp.]|nr:peptide chain release factor 1 [Polyangium sp.]